MRTSFSNWESTFVDWWWLVDLWNAISFVSSIGVSGKCMVVLLLVSFGERERGESGGCGGTLRSGEERSSYSKWKGKMAECREKNFNEAEAKHFDSEDGWCMLP